MVVVAVPVLVVVVVEGGLSAGQRGRVVVVRGAVAVLVRVGGVAHLGRAGVGRAHRVVAVGVVADVVVGARLRLAPALARRGAVAVAVGVEVPGDAVVGVLQVVRAVAIVVVDGVAVLVRGRRGVDGRLGVVAVRAGRDPVLGVVAVVVRVVVAVAGAVGVVAVVPGVGRARVVGRVAVVAVEAVVALAVGDVVDRDAVVVEVEVGVARAVGVDAVVGLVDVAGEHLVRVGLAVAVDRVEVLRDHVVVVPAVVAAVVDVDVPVEVLVVDVPVAVLVDVVRPVLGDVLVRVDRGVGVVALGVDVVAVAILVVVAPAVAVLVGAVVPLLGGGDVHLLRGLVVLARPALRVGVERGGVVAVVAQRAVALAVVGVRGLVPVTVLVEVGSAVAVGVDAVVGDVVRVGVDRGRREGREAVDRRVVVGHDVGIVPAVHAAVREALEAVPVLVVVGQPVAVLVDAVVPDLARLGTDVATALGRVEAVAVEDRLAVPVLVANTPGGSAPGEQRGEQEQDEAVHGRSGRRASVDQPRKPRQPDAPGPLAQVPRKTTRHVGSWCVRTEPRPFDSAARVG